MKDSSDVVILLKKIIKETIDSFDLSNCVIGEVVSASPLKIKLDQKITLEEMQIMKTRNVTDWVETINIDWTATKHGHGFNGDGSVVDGDTNLKGDYTIKHLNSLKVGEKVILFQEKGGQMYVVLDRV